MTRFVFAALVAVLAMPFVARADDDAPATVPQPKSLVAKAEDAAKAAEAKVAKLLDFHVRHQIPAPTKVVIDGSVACQMVGTELHCTARQAAPEQ